MTDGTVAWVGLALNLPRKNRFRCSAEDMVSGYLLKHRGNVSAAAVDLRLGRATLNRWIAKSPFIKAHLKKARGR